jgi:hypothetical protein
MKLVIFFAAAVSMAAPTSYASLLVAEVTDPVTGELVTGGGNYIAPGVDGYFLYRSTYFTIRVGFEEVRYGRFNTLQFDYDTTGATNFWVTVASRGPGMVTFPSPRQFATFEEPAGTDGFKTMVLDLKSLGVSGTEGYEHVFMVAASDYSGAFGGFDNIRLDALTAVPEPGSMFSLACLLGAGAFVRRRALRA